jgi:hypothetical protein
MTDAVTPAVAATPAEAPSLTTAVANAVAGAVTATVVAEKHTLLDDVKAEIHKVVALAEADVAKLEAVFAKFKAKL